MLVKTVPNMVAGIISDSISSGAVDAGSADLGGAMGGNESGTAQGASGSSGLSNSPVKKGAFAVFKPIADSHCA